MRKGDILHLLSHKTNNWSYLCSKIVWPFCRSATFIGHLTNIFVMFNPVHIAFFRVFQLFGLYRIRDNSKIDKADKGSTYEIAGSIILFERKKLFNLFKQN